MLIHINVLVDGSTQLQVWSGEFNIDTETWTERDSVLHINIRVVFNIVYTFTAIYYVCRSSSTEVQ